MPLRSAEQTRVMLIFGCVALAGSLALFLVPCGGGRGRPLLRWDECRDLPWGVLLLIGGGLALARSFEQTGLSEAIAGALSGAFADWHPLAIVAVVSATVTLLTEIASNTATISILLPLLFAAAVESGIHPLLVAIPATLSVSYGFALPVGTPPNAIAFATGRIRMLQMVRAGLILDFIAILLVTGFTWLWIGPRLGLDFHALPDWAAPVPVGP